MKKVWITVKYFFSKKWNMNMLGALTTVVLSAVVIFLCMVRINKREYIQLYFSQCFESPLLAVLNFLPILFVCMLLFFLTRHALFSAVATGFIFFALGLANFIKLSLRQDPLIPSDLLLMREAAGVIGDYSFRYILFYVILIAASVGASVFCCLKWKRTQILLPVRLICLAVYLPLTFFTINHFYPNVTLYNSFPYGFGGKDMAYGRKGFVYSFLHDIYFLRVNKPALYDPSAYDALESEKISPPLQGLKQPHVIMIMSEAYAHVSRHDIFDFSNYIDPTHYYTQYEAEALLSGTLIVDISGGGTAFTEFSTLTGISPVILSTETSPYSFVRKDMFTLPRAFRANGYDTLAIHPGYSWFYNRLNVYRHFGFDDFLYLEKDFDEATQMKGGYISEEATFDLLISRFQSHIETSSQPFFEFCVTIQNHSGYANKYFADDRVNFDSDFAFTAEEKNILSNYFAGVADADEQLNRLIAYLRRLDEPVVLIFYGDHMPSLSSLLQDIGLGAYNETLAEWLKMYAVPYMIWANDAALEQTDVVENLANATLSNHSLYSAFYLPAIVSQILGLDSISPFFSYVDDLREKLPVLTWAFYQLATGELVPTLPDALKPEMEFYEGWSYYKLFDELLNTR